MVETDASDYALATVLSIRTLDSDYHPVAFHSQMFKDTETNYDIHNKELTAIYDAFKRWQHYLEGASTPIDVVTDHRNLQYFSTTKVLTWRQARCSEYLSKFNMVICFCPGKLGTKPDVLTHCWDVYPKEGSSDYASINPQNLRPMFTNEQLASSLHTSTLWLPALRGSLIMDTKRLQADIISSLQSNPIALEHLSSNADPRWTTSPDGLLRLDDCIYVPDSGDLQLCVLQYSHDHPLVGHFGQTKTLHQVQRQYTWPGLPEFINTTASHEPSAPEPSHSVISPMGY